jgi:protein-S-isoprenylcysteine O-methyltransferase Ste14
VRVLLLAGALYMAIPAPRLVGLAMPAAIAAGCALACAGLGLLYWINRTSGRTMP